MRVPEPDLFILVQLIERLPSPPARQFLNETRELGCGFIRNRVKQFEMPLPEFMQRIDPLLSVDDLKIISLSPGHFFPDVMQVNQRDGIAPQAWITMMWHMKLRLPWTWRIGPSNSSERGHVVEMLETEEFPDETLFCGDAGFVGYPLWRTILAKLANFLIRVGANVSLLSETADIQKCGGRIVLCWPKGQMNSGEPPLHLRLVKIRIGQTDMWLLTSVLDRRKLTKKQIIRIYKMRWGIKVEFRGLKQTIDKHKLRCRNSGRLLVELDWSIRAMAVAELLALREQIAAKEAASEEASDPIDRSLANTMRALRTCMRRLDKRPREENGLYHQLSKALVQRYANHTDKRSRYRPKNPDKKPLGDPDLRTMTTTEREKLRELKQNQAA